MAVTLGNEEVKVRLGIADTANLVIGRNIVAASALVRMSDCLEV
jgi:hypothetical protein